MKKFTAIILLALASQTALCMEVEPEETEATIALTDYLEEGYRDGLTQEVDTWAAFASEQEVIDAKQLIASSSGRYGFDDAERAIEALKK